ncbi:unnamed protein product, partial [Brachionus calyciflorus]
FDDFNGQFCNQGKYPLVNAVKNALKGSGGFNPAPVIPTVRPTFRPTLAPQPVIPTFRPTVAPTRPPFNIITTKSQVENNKCPDGDGFYADFASNCEKYYFCVNQGKPEASILNFKCPQNLRYDMNTKSCNFASSVSCKPNQQETELTTIKPLNPNNNQFIDSPNLGSKKLIVCYHTNWAQYRVGDGKFVPENIEPNLCDIIIYSFAKLSGDKLEPFEWNDLSTSWSSGMYEKTKNLKKLNPSLKILIAVGGWNVGSGPFSDMVHSDQARKNFVRNSLQFLKDNGFDGLDLDWEYPGSREGSRSTDKTLFTTLCKELKDAFRPKNLLLTAAVGAGYETVVNGYEIDKISKHLDYINLMTYDLHGSWEKILGHNAPLYPRRNESPDQAKLNVEWAVNYWLSQGCPKEKLLVGLSLYGRSFTYSGNKNLGAPNTGPGSQGRFTAAPGMLSYYEVCEKIKQGWRVERNDEQKIPYAYSNNEWVGYDDPESLRAKARFIKEKNLAGGMFWSLDFDDFSGKFCNQGKFPLVNAVKSELSNGVVVRPVVTNKPVTPSSNFDQESICIFGNGYYPDVQNDCQTYFVCVGQGTSKAKAYRYSCPVGKIFDSKTKGCYAKGSVSCSKTNEKDTREFTDPPKPTTESTTETTTTKTTIQTKPPSPVTISETGLCKNGNGYYVRKGTNCQSYYYCAFVKTKFERVYNYTCSNNYKFNPAIRLSHGVRIRNAKVDTICYAYDILLVSQTKRDLREQLGCVTKYGINKFTPEKAVFMVFDKGIQMRYQDQMKDLWQRKLELTGNHIEQLQCMR